MTSFKDVRYHIRLTIVNFCTQTEKNVVYLGFKLYNFCFLLFVLYGGKE
jgi:hypothetical protein